MIKVIAFDLGGVLVCENDIEMSLEEEKLERLFGPNKNDSDYLKSAREIIEKDAVIMRVTEDLIQRLYERRDKDLFRKIKERFSDVKIVIATNHVSFVRNYIGETFGVDFLDDVIISAEINKIKPDKEFYQHILKKYNLLPSELLFLDDNQKNIESAKYLGINTIKVDKNTDIFSDIIKKFDS